MTTTETALATAGDVRAGDRFRFCRPDGSTVSSWAMPVLNASRDGEYAVLVVPLGGGTHEAQFRTLASRPVAVGAGEAAAL